ncbi:MAG: Kelch repeat-containing protein, partial [Acidimicrobiales bacterium]
MNGRRLTDAQISKALRAHLPDRAHPGLRERILDEAETTGQQRALPSVFGALRDADPVVRRRSLLIAAALLVALAFASAAAVGSLRLLQHDPVQDLSLEPRPSLQGVVAPSSTPSEPSAGPTSSPFPGPAGVWIATGTMGTPRYGFTAVRLLDGRVLVAGGTDSGANSQYDLTSAELYDPASGTWTATGNMVSGAGLDTATLLRGGKVLGVGGNGAEVYDPASGTWTATGKIVIGPGFATATLLRDGKVLVAGSGSAELYDPVSGTWTATGKMTTPRYDHTATLLPDGRVLAAGGYVPPDVSTSSAELYDPDTGSWTAIAKTGFGGMATLLQDGTVLFGSRVYDLATGTWTPTGDMARPGAGYSTATRLLDGTVLVAGGRSGNDATDTEVYDPATGSWTKTGSMLPNLGGDFPSRRPATLLLDGTVLVAGGSVCPVVHTMCPTGATGSAELYIPAGVSPPDLGPFASPTPTPVQTPVPTPFPPQAGPVPAGARSWT